MNRLPGFVVLFGLLTATAFGQQPDGEDRLPKAPEGKAWKLAWHDEFDGSTLDESKWETPPDGPRQGGWWMREAVSLDGRGHLVMRTIKKGDRFIDGCVRTGASSSTPSATTSPGSNSRNSPDTGRRSGS